MIEWYPYRIKTEEEFVLEYGSNWRRVVQFNCGGDMDFICGKQLPFSEDEVKDVLDNDWKYLRFHGWTIRRRMITENKKELRPSYNPRKFSREI